MSEHTIRTLVVSAAVFFLALVLAARVGVDIYKWGHQSEIKLWCWSGNPDAQSPTQEYKGPADKVIGACDVRR